MGATRRFSRGLRWQVSYTFGKVIDETQGQIRGDATKVQSFRRIRSTRETIVARQTTTCDSLDDERHLGAAVRRVLTGVAGALARGWQINGLGTIRSGVPFSPAIQIQRLVAVGQPGAGR